MADKNRFLVLTLFLATASQLSLAEPMSGLNTREFNQPGGPIKQRLNPFIRSPNRGTAQSMRVQAIVYNPVKQVALIAGKIVRKGDRIGSSEVIDIQRKSVALRNENGLFRLYIDQATEGKG